MLRFRAGIASLSKSARILIPVNAEGPMSAEQHERNRKALMYACASIEDGGEFDEIAEGIFENIQSGPLECDEFRG
jgi:hypothetical protein